FSAGRAAPLRQPVRPAPGARARRLHPAGPSPVRPGRSSRTAARSPAGCRRRHRRSTHRRRRVRGPNQGPAPRSTELMRVARWRLDQRDWIWLIGLTLIAGILRFASPIFLDVFAHPGSSAPISAWGLGHNYQDPSLPGLGKANDIAPNSPFVFDELYFANDAHNDLLGRDYFDPEPPLAKLIIALGIQLFGFNSFGWRFMPALFGTALIPLMYLLARQLLTVRFFAVAAGVLMAFDGMTFVESRTAVIDIIPITLVVLAYLFFHLHLSADSVSRRRWMIVLTGITLGLALGSKWTTL